MLSSNFAEMTTSASFRDLLHAANPGHLTNGFDSPSEGRHFVDIFAFKTPTASAGYDPRNLGTKGHPATPSPQKLKKNNPYVV
jgi:hypothetical protein